MARDLIQAAETFKTISPTTKVLISSVLPKIADNYIPGVGEVNDYLVQASMYLDFEVIHHHDFILNDKIDMSLFAKKEVEKIVPFICAGKVSFNLQEILKTFLKLSIIKNKDPSLWFKLILSVSHIAVQNICSFFCAPPCDSFIFSFYS